ncbi:MAG: helix-turn-helix domain-containing protein, partial [Actinobacteria bacterium]|nr:helix-turn-helix domain-containing protein [Actinomycetota bacterium]
GVLVASLVLDDAEFTALTELSRPVGLLGLERDGFLSARIDDVAAARTAVDHLVGLGRRRIALIGGDTDDPMAFTPPLHRRDGYRDALREAGLPIDPRLERLGYFTVEGGRAAARTLHLSVRALTYRLDRVRELTGRGVERPDDRFALQVAVLGAGLLGWPTDAETLLP